VSKSEDINTLFRRFGGDASSYQEIVSIDQAHAAEQHWPLLGQLRPLAGAEAPAAKRASAVGERVEQVEVVIYKTVPQIVHVVADPPPAPVAAPVPVSTPVAVDLPPVVVPAPVPVAPAVSAEVVPVAEVPVVAAPVSDLKSVFERMLPQSPDAAQPQAASPLKRLIKW
jgi:hypothetical protein